MKEPTDTGRIKKTVAFSKSAANVFLHLLTRCNLKCRHCYINPAQHGRGMLDIATVKSWLELFASRCEKANVILLGGEPTLHPDLALAVRQARLLGYQSVTIDTNGYLFHHILSRVDPGEVDFFSFSLDGATRQTNDLLRGRGSFERCTAGIRQAVERGFGTSLIYTVSSANFHELKQMAALVKKLGIDWLFIQVIGLRGQSAGPGLDRDGGEIRQVTRKDWLAVVPAVAAEIARLGIPVTYPRVFLEPDEPFECAGNLADNYFVFPNGRVYRCPLCEDHPLHSFRIEDDRLVEMPGINESDLFSLTIPEGCVMNRLIQPGNLRYGNDGQPAYRIACCLLKEEVCYP